MYALPNKTQHKLIAKVRGGISQKLDNFNITTTTTSSSTATTTTTTFPSASLSSTTSNSSSCSSPTSTTSFSSSNNSNREFSPSSATFNANTATLLSKESTTTNRFNNIDKAITNLELNNCLPQPVFHHTNHGNSKQRSYATRAQKQCITPEHNEMIKYVQQSWKGVERDYKKSVNNYINNIDINGSSKTTTGGSNGTTTTPASTAKTNSVTNDHHQLKQQKQGAGKKKTSTTSTPLLLTGSYHHNSVTKDSTGNNRQDSFRPFDLEAFWGNRILKRLTQDL